MINKKDIPLINSSLSVDVVKASEMLTLLNNKPCGVIDFNFEDGDGMGAMIEYYLPLPEIVSETKLLRYFHASEPDAASLPNELILFSIDAGGNYLLFDVNNGGIHFIHHEMPWEIILISRDLAEFKQKLHPPEEIEDEEVEIVHYNKDFIALQRELGNTNN